MPNHMLLKLSNFIFTTFLCLSISSSEFYQLSLITVLYFMSFPWGLPVFRVFLQKFLKWLSLLHLLQVFPYADHCLTWCEHPHYLHFLFSLDGCLLLLLIFCVCLDLCFDFLIIALSLVYFRLYSINFY